MKTADPSPSRTPPVLHVEHVGKEYKLYDAPKDRLTALLTGRSTHRSHWAHGGWTGVCLLGMGTTTLALVVNLRAQRH